MKDAGWNEIWTSNRIVMFVTGELDSACGLAMVSRLEQILKATERVAVVDLSHAQGLSMMGMAMLLEKAKAAGFYGRLSFRVTSASMEWLNQPPEMRHAS